MFSCLPESKYVKILQLYHSPSFNFFYLSSEKKGVNHGHCPMRSFNINMNSIEIVEQTLTAESIDEPFASSAAMHDAKVQPVP